MKNANEMRKNSVSRVNQFALAKALSACEKDIEKESNKGNTSLSRNAYVCYIGYEDRGILEALITELKKHGYKVLNRMSSYWVGSLNISW